MAISAKIRNMDNEEKKKLLSRLQTIAKETDAAIRELEAQISTGELPVCPYCGLEIQLGEKTKRRVHSRCYFAARTLVEAGKTTWKKLEASGKVGRGTSGRPKKALAEAEVEIEMKLKDHRRVKRKRSDGA